MALETLARCWRQDGDHAGGQDGDHAGGQDGDHAGVHDGDQGARKRTISYHIL